nr:hypothetical protein [Tanacetum cinerariifolium]
MEGPMIIEAEIRGHFIHQIYVDGGSASEILYEHYFNRLRPEVKSQMIPATAPLNGFSGEIIWPMGQILLLVKIGDAKQFTSTWMNFMVVRSLSPYNEIIGRPGVRKIQAERIKVAIHPEYPEQTIAIGSTLTEDGRKALCDLLRRIRDVFAWKLADMKGVSRHITKHRLNVREKCPAVRQKKTSQAPERNKAIQEEVEKNGGRRHNERSSLSQLVIKSSNDDLVIKSCTEHEIIRDMEETLKTLRNINMKLNPKKCTLKIEEGTFLGYKVNTEGIMKEELIVYLAAAQEAVSAFLMTKREAKQMPVYFVSLPYKAHTIIVITDQPIKQILSRPEVARRLQNWSIELDDSLDTPMEAEEEFLDP